MLFNSYYFLFIFLPIIWGTYFFVNKICKTNNSGKILLLVSSLYFYYYASGNLLFLLLFSIIMNYSFYKFMNYIDKYKNLILFLSIIANVALLFYFKYIDFFIHSLNYIFSLNLSLENIVFPLAISFFTIQQIAFLVDTYYGTVKKTNILDYSLFVSFFPQLIMGPIVHHREMITQFADTNNKSINYKNVNRGISLLILGLFMKILIADIIAETYVDIVWKNLDYASFIDFWISSIGFMFQLFFDFAGYITMALGIGLLFNIKLPINFNKPFLALNVTDFWSRWHITLTNFVTAYINTPLVRLLKKPTKTKIVFIMIISMTIVGIWHGANMTYLVFGLLHGIAIAINYFNKSHKIKYNKYLAWFLTMLFIDITWVIFRAPDINTAFFFLEKMFNFSNFSFVSNLDLISLSNNFINLVVFMLIYIDIYRHKAYSINKHTFVIYFLMFFFAVYNISKSDFLYYAF